LLKESLNDVVSNERKKLFDEYVNNPKRILSDFNKENAEIEGYHGRELLELLQNAVDELMDSCDRAVKIEIFGNILRFSNNGNVFSEEGIISILYSHLSPKHNKNEYIGNKGTGFRSVLNWAESIRIYSGNLSVEFSQHNADEMLIELLEHESVRDYKEKFAELKVATLVAPKIIPPLQTRDFDTIIEIVTIDGVLNDIYKQLADITSSTLLFLEKLERLVLINGDSKTEYRKNCHLKENITTIEEYKNDELVSSEEWSVTYKSYEEDQYKFDISIAYKPDMSVEPGFLFSYFKTEVPMPFPMLVHATFDLDASRNHLNQTARNRMVLEKICRLMAEIAKSNYNESNYNALRLLAPRKELPSELAWADFENIYLRTIADTPLFPTVNGEYISFAENPKFYSDTNIADYLCGEYFNNLLIYSTDEHIRSLISTIGNYKKMTLVFSYDEISKKINAILRQLSIPERAALCVRFIKEYKNEIKSGNYPDFIIDSYNHVIGPEQQVFLPPEGAELPSPPKFASLVFMNKELAIALKNEIGGDWRDTAMRLNNLSVREYNLRQLIQSVISKFNYNRNKDTKKTIPDSIQLLKWLWKLSKSGRLKGENTLELTLNVPMLNRAGSVAPANTLYIGREYGNRITDNIYPDNDQLFAASMQIFDISDNETADFTDFLFRIGVARFPRQKRTTIIPVPGEYIEMLARERTYPVEFDRDGFFKNEDDFKKASIPQVEVTLLEHYEIILKHADTTHILEWLMADPESWAIITANTETDTSSNCYIRWGKKQDYRIMPNHLLSSYMRYKFSQSAWFRIDNKRYSPCQIFFKNGIGDKLLPYAIEPDLDIYIKNSHQVNTEKNRIQTLLLRLGASDRYSHLSTEALYGILLKLPEFDKDGSISRTLYLSLVDDKEIYFDHNNTKRKEYQENGLVFCKSSKGFVRCSDAKYLTERMVSREVQKSFNLIDIPSRKSKVAIRECLFVSALELKGSISGMPTLHPLNNDFQNTFSHFKDFAFCYRVDTAKQSEISSMKSLKVCLCTELSAEYDNNISVLDDYSFIRGKDAVYLKISSSLDSITAICCDIGVSEAVAEIITSLADIQDGEIFIKLCRIFSQNQENRETIIKREFDSLEILTRSKEALNSASDFMEMLKTVCKKILGNLPQEIIEILNLIDLNTYHSLGNAPIFIRLLDALDIDASVFNELSEEIIHIDLRPYFISKLEELRDAKRKIYKDALFYFLKDKPVSMQKTFAYMLEEYSAHTYVAENTKFFNTEQIFLSLWEILAQINIQLNGADYAWQQNKKTFEKNKDNDIISALLSDKVFDSLLYFGVFDELEKIYGSKKRDLDTKEKNDTTVLSSTANLVAPIEEINVISPSKVEVKEKMIGSGNLAVGMALDRNNSSWGAKAEEIVFNSLVGRYKNVEWVSENAKKKGKNSAGIAGLGYDITYIDDKGQPVYVEVKSTSGNSISFMITSNEIEVGECKKEKYMVALVTNVENDYSRRIYIIKDLFVYQGDETRFSNKRFKLSADNYTLRCNRKSDGAE